LTTNATPRLVVALAASAAGVLLAVLGGRPQAAALAAPWVVLVVLGLSGGRRSPVSARVRVVQERVVVGQRVGIEIDVEGARGWVEASCRPSPGFQAGNGPGPADTDAGGGPDGEGDRDGTTDPDDPLTEDVPAAADVARPDDAVRLSCALSAPTWGTHDVGRVDLRIHERYGLLTRSGVAHTPQPIRVHPRPVDLRRLLAPWFVRRLTGAHRSRAAGDGVEYADIRPYGPGDPLR
jgi:uncharacterized protein (DUF58 family)